MKEDDRCPPPKFPEVTAMAERLKADDDRRLTTAAEVTAIPSFVQWRRETYCEHGPKHLADASAAIDQIFESRTRSGVICLPCGHGNTSMVQDLALYVATNPSRLDPRRANAKVHVVCRTRGDARVLRQAADDACFGHSDITYSGPFQDLGEMSYDLLIVHEIDDVYEESKSKRLNEWLDSALPMARVAIMVGPILYDGSPMHRASKDSGNRIVFVRSALSADGKEALWPEAYSVSRLHRKRERLGERWFRSTYQNDPAVD
jgi:hypothetical protein